MKKYLISLSALSMMLLSCLMAVCVSSCGGDDDDDPVTPPGGGGSSKAATAYVTPCVYIAERLLKYTNVVLADGSGKTYEITLNNTEVVSGQPALGQLAKRNANVFRQAVDNYSDNLRLFKLDRATYKSFPVTVKLSVTATATADGSKPAATEKIPSLLTVDVDLANDADGSFSGLNLSGSFSYTAYSGSKWESFINSKNNPLKSSLEITLESAERCSGRIGK